MTTPKAIYQALIDAGELEPDVNQAKVIDALEAFYPALNPQWRWRRPRPNHYGLYLWGSVGSGKTCLMDLLYQCLPTDKSWRCHSHVFFETVHNELTALQASQKDPVPVLAQRLAKRAHIICLDEFHVDDITQAMLLTRLLPQLFALGAFIVTTSNIQPSELYKNGLQRQNFLPTITLIENQMLVIQLSSNKDYRQRHPQDQLRWHTPCNEEAAHAMQRQFLHLSEGPTHHKRLWIAGRPLTVKQRSDNIAWFDFAALCHPPRCKRDYLQLTKKFQFIFVSNIPIIAPHQYDIALNFIHLIDVLYDHNIELYCSAHAHLANCYPAGKYTEPFKRTRSRLKQMMR